jgi:hypothetical protein
VLGFSEQALGWVKKFIQKSEKGLCKGLALFPYDTATPKNQEESVEFQLLNQGLLRPYFAKKWLDSIRENMYWDLVMSIYL